MRLAFTVCLIYSASVLMSAFVLVYVGQVIHRILGG